MCWCFFAEKNVSSFCSAKATHIFSAKNIRILYIESAKTVNELTLNELVKLTTLWTTGPWWIQKSVIRLRGCLRMTSYTIHHLNIPHNFWTPLIPSLYYVKQWNGRGDGKEGKTEGLSEFWIKEPFLLMCMFKSSVIQFSRRTAFLTRLHVRPAKTQTSLRVRAVWSESSLSAWRLFWSLATGRVPCEDSDQTARMRRLIWIFAGHTSSFVGNSVSRLLFVFT